jgi:MFS family permease
MPPNPAQRLANGASHAVGFFVLLGFGLASPVLPLLAGDLGLTVASIGAAVAAFAVGRLIFGLGSLFGLTQMRHMLHLGWLVGGCLLTAAAAAWCALAPDAIQLIAARALQGIGSAMAMLAASIRPFVLDDDAALGRRVGNQQSVFMLGTAIGPIIGGVLGQFAGLHAPFWVTAALALCGIPCGLVAHRLGAGAGAVAAEPVTGPRVGTSRRLRVGMPAAAAALVIVAVANADRSGFRTTFFPLWSNDVLGMSETMIGVALSVGALGFLSFAVVGRLVDVLGAARVLAAGGVLLAVASGLVLVFPTVWAGFVAMVLSTMGASSTIVAASTIILAAGSGSRRLIAIRNQRVATDAGMFLGPLLVGVAIGAWGYSGALAALTVVGFAVVFAALAVRPDTHSAVHPPTVQEDPT